jgi:LmbE family N-acetylglucosaminyl deacetylase
MNVLAIGAHPDDLEILCGGTLARYAADGHRVTMCHVATGNRGGWGDRDSDELAATRAAEAQSAAALIGARHACTGVPDGEIDSSSLAQRTALVDVVREAHPDVILTHATNDYASDHNEVFRLALDSSLLASIPLFRTELEATAGVPPIFHMDTVTGIGFEPTEYVDVTSTIELKLQMLSRHESQVSWLGEHADNDVMDTTRALARVRGAQCGVNYAEGFRPCLRWPRMTTRRLLP